MPVAHGHSFDQSGAGRGVPSLISPGAGRRRVISHFSRSDSRIPTRRFETCTLAGPIPSASIRSRVAANNFGAVCGLIEAKNLHFCGSVVTCRARAYLNLPAPVGCGIFFSLHPPDYIGDLPG